MLVSIIFTVLLVVPILLTNVTVNAQPGHVGGPCLTPRRTRSGVDKFTEPLNQKFSVKVLDFEKRR